MVTYSTACNKTVKSVKPKVNQLIVNFNSD